MRIMRAQEKKITEQENKKNKNQWFKLFLSSSTATKISGDSTTPWPESSKFVSSIILFLAKKKKNLTSRWACACCVCCVRCVHAYTWVRICVKSRRRCMLAYRERKEQKPKNQYRTKQLRCNKTTSTIFFMGFVILPPNEYKSNQQEKKNFCKKRN